MSRLCIWALMSLGVASAACGSYPSTNIRETLSPNTGGAGGGGSPNSGGSPAGGGGGGMAPGSALPCDIFEAAGHPCVSAHSTVRRIVSGYNGPLYQVEHLNGTKLDIGIVDGVADAAAHDQLCGKSSCVIPIIYDQTPIGNHLTPAPPGSQKPTPGNPARASVLPVTVHGRAAYGILIRPNIGYRAACNECPYPEGGPRGTAVDDEPQTMYMVTSQQDVLLGCCFNYGNAEVTSNNDGSGTMETVYFGHGVIWGSGVQGGPWVMCDMEDGVFAGWENNSDQNISTNTPLAHDFVSAMVVGDTQEKNNGLGRFALYGGDATAGLIKEMYDGIRPQRQGYNPMKKQGSVILGIGGDNSNAAGGRFYEGVMANGAATKETLDALQASIVAAGYGK